MATTESRIDARPALATVLIVSLYGMQVEDARADCEPYSGNSEPRFFSIDLANCQTTTINQVYRPRALATHPETGVVYGGNSQGPGKFFTVRPSPMMINDDLGYGIRALAFCGTTLYGANSGEPAFFRIDLETGDRELIDDETQYTVNAMTYDSGSGTLYGGNSAGRFFTIDPTNGSQDEISSGGYGILGMAFNRNDGLIYAGNVGRIFTIDPSTGAKVHLCDAPYPIRAFTYDRPCQGDLDSNCQVDLADLSALVEAWGSGGPADLDLDGEVTVTDLVQLILSWGPCH